MTHQISLQLLLESNMQTNFGVREIPFLEKCTLQNLIYVMCLEGKFHTKSFITKFPNT